MVGSSLNQTQDFGYPSSPPYYARAPHAEHYGDVSGPLRCSTALSLPEAESSDEIDEIEELETGGLYSTRKLPNLDFAPTHEGSLLGSINTRIDALHSTAANAQTRYSRAINSSIPHDPAINRNVRITVANTLWNSTQFFEEEAAIQLLRYREMFIYLSQRHAESLASSSLYEAQHFARRGQISIAAIRLTDSRSRSNYNHSIAQGHHARHSSEVSVWGWKPWREIALAEKVCERRRQRIEIERERGRDKRSEVFSRGRKFGSLGDHEDADSGSGEEVGGDTLQLEPPSTKVRIWRRRMSPETSTGKIGLVEEVHHPGGKSTDTEYSTNDPIITPDSGTISPRNARPLTDGATSQEDLAATSNVFISEDLGPPGWIWHAKHEIIWRIPVYHDVSSSSLTIPPPDRKTRPTMPTIVTASNAKGMIQRIHTINEPSGMGYISSSSSSGLGPVISPQISPKSHVSPNTSSSGNDAPTMSTDEASFVLSPETIASLSRRPSVRFPEGLDHRKRLTTEPNDSSSDSTIGISRGRDKLHKVKIALKSFSLKNVHFPWSSSSEEETQVSANSSNDPSSSEQSWPLNGNIPPKYGLVPPPTQQKHNSYSEYLDKPAPQTRIHSPHPQSKIARKKVPVSSIRSPPHPGVKIPGIRSRSTTTESAERAPMIQHQESDPLTRTEKEYQEILSALSELKREMRFGRKRVGRGKAGQ